LVAFGGFSRGFRADTCLWYIVLRYDSDIFRIQSFEACNAIVWAGFVYRVYGHFHLYSYSNYLIINILKQETMKVDYMTIPEITVSYKDNVKASERAVIKNSADAAKILAVAFEDCMEHHEEAYVLYMNRANRVLGISCISKGGLNGTVVDVRIILQTALKVSCSSIMLSHNHPSGSTHASREDICMTKAVKAGCEAVGIHLSDHIIMTDETYMSFADEGLL
jgi:hypothetical protein